VVGDHAHVKPMLRFLARHRRFALLALSAGDVRLWTATPFDREELALTELPPTLQAELDSRPAAEAGVNSERSLEEARKELLVEDLRRVADAVRAALAGDPAPLVLAAEPQTAGHFMKLPGVPQLHPEPMLINPFALPEAELHQRATALLAPVLEAEQQAVLEAMVARLGTAEPTVGIKLEEILGAARDGRVDALAVAEDEAIWGHFNRESGAVAAHGRRSRHDEDLLNVAAVLALASGARAFARPRADLPREAHAAALYRY